jgi:valyl-tRNA synthetase
MADDFEPRYDPQKTEEAIYKKWEDSGFFDPDVCVEKGVTAPDAEPFSIVLPPPNVTGTLHMGHAAMLAIEDILVRFARMQGKRTLWLPGTDHAAIATQSKVEKEILKTEKKSRHDLGREEFLRRVREFAQESHDAIVHQVKRLGASLDWGREAYTLDAKREVAVRTAFKIMYDLGLIYRGDRVVNWDPKGQTTISDDEIVYEERRAKLYTFKYSPDFPIAISTTRPETKFGDTGVAVHPDDERYKKYVGKEYDIEFCGEPLHIKIIADQSVEKDFGTGALGVTPAHSMIDWEIAERHDLPLKQVINEYGRMMVGDETIRDKKTAEAREAVIEKLRSAGLIEKEEEVSQNVATAERTGGVIEPLPKLQWFIAVNKKFGAEGKTLKELMKEAVTGGGIKILPERFERIYFNWIDNLRDWCISRQIWFGHQIPVFYCMNCRNPQINAEIKSKWFFVRHGESQFNKEKRSQGQMEGNPLTEQGIAQARDAAERLKHENIRLIISSDLERCAMTAEIIAAATGAELVFDKRLRERSLGVAEGISREERTRLYGNVLQHYEERIPGGETWKEVEARLQESLAEHRKNHTDKNLVIVTHGAPINFLIGKLKNTKREEAAQQSIPQNANIATVLITDPCQTCGEKFFEQDPDTLDTWFSSGLWPFSTLGWPDKTEDLKNYFPNSVLETGYDILFFWVARMILMSTCLTGQVPFRTVYLHGLVRDDKGRKMSKSLGNIIDPLTMADKYGADATRLSLVIGAAPGNDLKLSEDRVRGYRNFSTKIWNMARFIAMNKPESGERRAESGEEKHKAYLEEFAALKKEVTAHIENFEFHLAAEKSYHYVWHTLADVVIEAEKETLKNGAEEAKAASYAVLEELFLGSLKLLHPFMPFVTEAVWQKFRPGTLLMVEKW